ncbi:hypothetical protein [Brevibacillus gelatini]
MDEDSARIFFSFVAKTAHFGWLRFFDKAHKDMVWAGLNPRKYTSSQKMFVRFRHAGSLI